MAIKTAPVSLARLQEGIYYLENIEKEKKNLPKGGRQKLSSGFCPLRGYPPPNPLTENHFAKKPLAEKGGQAHVKKKAYFVKA